MGVLPGGEIEKVTVGKLRGVEKLYNFEEGVEIAAAEITELNNRNEVADKEEVAEISLTQEERKGKERSENEVRKLKKEIEKNNSKELIIDRAKENGGIPNQIDISAAEFQELEEDKGAMIKKEEELIP